MRTITTSDAALAAFKNAVIEDWNDRPRYPDGAIVLPAERDFADVWHAVKHYDPAKTPIVFVRDDGFELGISPRRPETLRERVLFKIGRLPHDVDIRPSNGTPVYRDQRVLRSARDVADFERRAFAGPVPA